ncbi:MAG: flagellar motor switch protein FliM [Clostridiales bacterium]|nr:flagellar motor switch protein FliM [Clostridiales bacterium]
MNEVLSQAEIDQLLKDIVSGNERVEVEKKGNNIKRYDFKTANKFTKEQIRAISIVYRSFGYSLSNYFVGMLRAACDAEVLSIEEMSFNEFNNSVPTPAVIAIINSVSLPSSIIIQLSKKISYSIIKSVLGGTREVNSEGRQFTEIELAILERVVSQMLRIHDDSWSKMFEFKSTLERIETSMQFAQIVDLNEAVLMVTLNMTIGNESGIIGLCLPHQALEPFMKTLRTRFVYSGRMPKKQTGPSDSIISSLKNSDIVVSCEFNTTEATTRDILSLSVGDVIMLQHKINEPLILKCQQIPKYYVSVGTIKNHLAVKIINNIMGEEDID